MEVFVNVNPHQDEARLEGFHETSGPMTDRELICGLNHR
jgi:hypothetical protein